MTEKLARAQAERERAEKRVATETARLPVYALEQSRTTAPAALRRGGAPRQAARKSTPGHSLATFQRAIAMCCEIAADRDRKLDIEPIYFGLAAEA